MRPTEWLAPPELEDEARDIAYNTLKTRRADGLDRRGIELVFLTNDPRLDGAKFYGRPTFFCRREDVGTLRPSQGVIHGERLRRLGEVQARIAVPEGDLDQWQAIVEHEIREFGIHLVEQDLLDVDPVEDDFLVMPTGPGLVLLRWGPGVPRQTNAAGLGIWQWNWVDRRWEQPTSEQLTDPLR